MKIEIEFNSSHEATITIDGKKLTYGAKGGCLWTFGEGVTPQELDNTIGGLVAMKLTSPLIDILQGWLPDEESPDGDCWETWEQLTESAREEVGERLD